MNGQNYIVWFCRVCSAVIEPRTMVSEEVDDIRPHIIKIRYVFKRAVERFSFVNCFDLNRFKTVYTLDLSRSEHTTINSTKREEQSNTFYRGQIFFQPYTGGKVAHFFFTFTFRTIVLRTESVVIGPKIENIFCITWAIRSTMRLCPFFEKFENLLSKHLE